ncbi:MAG: radical SAM protein [Oligoflexia bacterium]|nr:radical SAM protein [Oligoflexia bacterium]
MLNIRIENISPEVMGTDRDLGFTFKEEKWLDYRKRWDNNPLMDILEEAPLQIDLFAVDVCNLKCPMCVREAHINGNGYMDVNLVKKIIDQATEYGVPAFNFGGLGEPTLYPHLFEILKYAKDRGIIDVNIHTNGTRLSPEFNKKLIETGLDRIIISVDSNVKNIYEKIRIGANFEKTYSGIKDFIDQRNLLGKEKPHIKVNYINTDEDDPTQKNDFINYWKDKVNRIAVLRYLDCSNGEGEVYHQKNYEQDKNFCCAELWRRLCILSDGVATICTNDMKKKYIVGDVRKETISEIWKGERIQKARNFHRKGLFRTIDKCKNCPDSFDPKKRN